MARDDVGVPAGLARGLLGEVVGEGGEGVVEVELFAGVCGAVVELLSPAGEGGELLEEVAVLPPVLLEAVELAG